MSSFTNVFHWPKNSVFERPSKVTDSPILSLNKPRAPDHSEHMNTRGCFTKITKTTNKEKIVMHLLQNPSIFMKNLPQSVRILVCSENLARFLELVI